jgi:histidinol-phosphate/aromatic aminotransferase/cobyric acid decarboxylase-like protein
VEVKDPKAEAIEPIDDNKIIAIKNPINPMGRLSMM